MADHLSSQIRDTTPSTTCYSLTGLESPFDSITYIPCNITAVENGQHSACCAPDDLCLSNGLCKFNNPNPSANFNEYWRVACTDPTYEDPACPKQCATIERDDPDMPTHLVFKCPGDGKWCCATGNLNTFPGKGTVNTTCCDIDDLAFAEDGIVYTTAQKATLDLKTSSTSIETSTQSQSIVEATQTAEQATTAVFTASAVTLESAATATSTSSPTPAPSDSNSSIPTAVGAGVGIPFGCALLIALVWLILRHRRLKRERGERFGDESHEDVRRTHPHAFWVEPGGKELAVELEAQKDPVEIWSPSKPSEAWVPNHNKEGGWGTNGAVVQKESDFGWTQTSPTNPQGAWTKDRQNDKGWGYGGSDAYR